MNCAKWNGRSVIFILFLWAGFIPTASAEQAERFGPYVAHYNTFNTTLLTPEVARAYGITRSGNLALLNIAVLRSQQSAMDEAVTARIQVNASNLVGQKKSVEMKEIRDQGAIYYIGTFRISNEERITFNVSIQPEDSTQRPHGFRFSQIFYVND